MAYPQPGQFPDLPQYPGQAGMAAKPVPQTVRNAFYLMLTGAALELVAIAVGLATTSKIRDSIVTRNPGFTVTQVDRAVNVLKVTLVVVALIEMGLWIWMAFANRAGKNWARITGTVFFGLSCIGLIFTVIAASSSNSNFSGSGSSGLSVVVGVVAWAVGLFATVLLWAKGSSAFFEKPQPVGGYPYPYPYGYGAPGQQPMPPTPPQSTQQSPYGTPPQGQPQPPADPWSNPPQ
jgi:hypothetical protein